MRVPAQLTSFTAMTAGLAILVPMAPANAVPPSVVGDYAGVTATVVQSIRGHECTDAASIKLTMDLTGVGAALEGAQWYSEDRGEPVRTQLAWAAKYEVVGPNNFYTSWEDDYSVYPTSELPTTLSVCPDEFGTGQVTPGTYALTAVLSAETAIWDEICHPQEPCNEFENIYTKNLAASFVLDYSPLCYEARAQVPEAVAKLKAARKALKRAKAQHKPRPVIRKRQRAVARAKAALVKARANVDGLC